MKNVSHIFPYVYLQNSKALISLYIGRYTQTAAFFCITLDQETSIAMYEQRISKLALLFLNFGGQNPHIYDSYSHITTWTMLLCAVLVSPMILIKMFNEFDDIDVLVPTFESLMSVCQVNKIKQYTHPILFDSFS